MKHRYYFTGFFLGPDPDPFGFFNTELNLREPYDPTKHGPQVKVELDARMGPGYSATLLNYQRVERAPRRTRRLRYRPSCGGR